MIWIVKHYAKQGYRYTVVEKLVPLWSKSTVHFHDPVLPDQIVGNDPRTTLLKVNPQARLARPRSSTVLPGEVVQVKDLPEDFFGVWDDKQGCWLGRYKVSHVTPNGFAFQWAREDELAYVLL